MNASLQAYQVDHLFLLMGENPLPNYVAAMTLLNQGGTVYLVHTTHTRTQAESLRLVLQQAIAQLKVQFISLGDQQSNAYHIRQQIQAQATKLSGRLGMNYTGGTKAMAVHAYRAVQEVQADAVFSYLDPYRSAMCFDNNEGDCTAIPIAIKLSLAQLFKLHGLTWRNQQPPIAEPLLPEVATKFAQLHGDAAIADAWRSWCHNELRGKARNGNYWKEDLELAQLPSLSLRDVPGPMKQVLREYLDASQESLSLQITSQGRFQSLRQVCEWLDGIWLEHYVLQQVQTIESTYAIHESKLSFRIQDPVKSVSWEKFEFDVAFMRDYQLFALSCTTTDKRGLCKQKLFEASLRARQLGGAEARVALVCCHDYPTSIKSELEMATRNRKLAVFGREDLGNLAQRIANWIRQNS